MSEQFRHGNLIVSSSPHLLAATTTRRLMAEVIIALLPAFAMAVWVFGARAIFLTAVCVLSCLLCEYLWMRLRRQPATVGDLSAVVTGLILAFNLPVTLPYWQAALGGLIAIIVVKQLFGGLGQNFANPAATARIVLFISFTPQMTSWALPQRIFSAADAVTGATPLALLAEGNLAALPSNWTMFLGLTGGSLGETSALALLLGGLFLILRRTISPLTPLCFLGTMAVIALAAGQDPVFHLCAGGAMLGAFFMATDYATSPLTNFGRAIFGCGCGLLTMLIRLFGSYPEGVSFAILIMNILVPHLDNLARRRLYGGVKHG